MLNKSWELRRMTSLEGALRALSFSRKAMLSVVKNVLTPTTNKTESLSTTSHLKKGKNMKDWTSLRQFRKSFCWWKFVYHSTISGDMKLLSLVFIIASIYSAHCVACPSKNDNVETSPKEQWREYKVNAN